MPRYRRFFVPGGCYFFTVVTADRKPIFADENNVEHLKQAFKREMERRPFILQAIVVLPDHVHALWELPKGDADFSNRWREIKKHVSKSCGQSVWQKHYWEHCIRDDDDWAKHLDYIHFNPVRHGYTSSACEWKWSSFHRWQQQGVYSHGWGSAEPDRIKGMACE